MNDEGMEGRGRGEEGRKERSIRSSIEMQMWMEKRRREERRDGMTTH